MSLDVGTKCETCLPSPSLETGLNMFVLCYKIKWAKERSNRESRGFVTEGVDGRMAEYIQTNTQGLHGSVVHATVTEYLKNFKVCKLFKLFKLCARKCFLFLSY